MTQSLDPTNGTPYDPSASLDLGGSAWVPTQPAPEFTGLLPAEEAGYYPAARQSVPAYGQSQPTYGQSQPAQPYAQPTTQPYAQPQPGYQVYESGNQSLQPYAYQQGVAPMAAPLIPGQVVQTPYGAFQVGQKSKIAAGLLGIFLGGLGVGQFYRGNVGLGIAQLIVTFVTLGFGALWGFIEGIIVLCSQPGSPCSLDSNRQLMI